MAVLAAAAGRGWQLADVRAAVGSGAWTGLAALYERRSEPGRMARLLPCEWRKAIGFVSGEKNVRHRPTSDNTSRPPADESALAAEYGLIRAWLTAVLVAAEDPERVRRWGGRVIAVGGVHAFDVTFTFYGKPAWVDFAMDYWVFSYLVAISVGTGLLFGLSPAWRLSRIDVNVNLKDAGRGVGMSRRQNHFSGLLVVTEMALALILSVCAGVMIRSVLKMSAVSVGVDSGQVTTMRLGFTLAKYGQTPAQVAFYDHFMERVKAVSFVHAVALTTNLPSGGSNPFTMEFEGGRLRPDLVVRLHWLTEAQLLDAIAISQATPGPFFTVATFIGYLLGGWRGAVLGTIGMFLPAFAYVGLTAHVLPKLRKSPFASAFLDGVNAAAVALMGFVGWQFARASLVNWLAVLIAVASLFLVFRCRVNSAWLVIGGAVAGILLRSVGWA
jgi:chromate transport protein ChrA